ncbi:MAG: 30S ribosomal protein S3 [Cytophagia bacterium]|nr:MAG: 30S ribosomal protein S3 [Cytophagia bacterium]TAG43591.1 MAG: 30S ribosomal protein S3 [Cytophagia bacterium]
MGQKINPNSLRLGIIRGWDSNWFGGKDFSQKLVEDDFIRKYINKRISKGAIARVVIERTLKRVTLTIHTAKPGVVIGKGGAEVDKIKEELKKLTKKDVQINIYEIKRPETDAKLVGETIAQQLEARFSYRRAMKQAIQNSMRSVQGIKIKLSGRLAGAEMARTEQYKEGRVPLHTLRADIDYAVSEAHTIYGKIGIKVWIFKKEIYGKPDLSPNTGINSAEKGNFQGGNYSEGGNRGGNSRGGGGSNDRNNNNRNRNNNNKGGNNKSGDNKGGNNNNNRNNNNRNNNNNGGNNKKR